MYDVVELKNQRGTVIEIKKQRTKKGTSSKRLIKNPSFQSVYRHQSFSDLRSTLLKMTYTQMKL